MADKSNYEPEEDVPDRLTSSHKGSRVVFRIPNQAILSEGKVEEFTKSENYLRIGRSWLINARGTVLAILDNKATERTSPYDS